ncbi:MAG: hypothetical protein FWH11_06495 [Micrococcales bacterium]|nr:hypothetical protein [Micrococcales bacterium]
MPLFELGSGRVRLVQPMQPRASTFTAEVRAVVAHNLQAVVPEPLFVVHEHDGREGSGLPDLLALDPTGRPVTIEVIHQLDHDAFLAALRRAGSAGRMTESDLGHVYHPADPARFSRDFGAFRAGLPFGIQAPRRIGPRIVVLCADVAPEAHDAADFWQSRGGRLDILQVGVVLGEDQCRLLSVAPHATYETRRRVVEPTGLHLVPGGMFDATDTRAQSIVEEQHRVAVNDDVRPVPPLAPSVEQTLPRARPDTSWAPPPAAAASARTAGPGRDGPAEAASARAAQVAVDPRPMPSPAAQSRPATLEPLGPAEPAVLRKFDMLAAPLGLPPAVDDRPHLARTTSVAYPELVELVNETGPTQLVWLRRRRGERLIARLRIDGLIELPDGRRFDDPSAAASAAARSEGEFDGWTSWRLGDNGPTLAEAIQQRHPF